MKKMAGLIGFESFFFRDKDIPKAESYGAGVMERFRCGLRYKTKDSILLCLDKPASLNGRYARANSGEIHGKTNFTASVEPFPNYVFC